MTTTARTDGDAGRLIGRLPVERRRAVLAAVVTATRHGSTVAVEYSYYRKLDEDATTVIATVVGYGHGSAGESLVVRPIGGHDLSVLVIPVAHVLRVRWAHDETGQRRPDPAAYTLGAVLAGPAHIEE